MTRKKDTALAQPVTADKWERKRQAERITVQGRKSQGARTVHRKTPRTESTTKGQHCRSRWPSYFMGTK